MATKRKRTGDSRAFIVPPGAARRVLQRLHRRALATLARQLRVSRKALIRNATIRATGLSSVARVIAPRWREVAEAYKLDRDKMQRLLDRQPPVILDVKHGRSAWITGPHAVSLISCQQPPYEFQTVQVDGSPKGGGTPTADPATGLLHWQYEVTGIQHIFPPAGVEATWNRGAAFPVVGINYFVQSAGWLVATVTATVSAQVFIDAALFGYASAWLALRSEVFGGSYPASIDTDIYSNTTILGIDTRQINSHTYSCTVRMHIEKPKWVLVIGEIGANMAARGLADARIECSMKIERICVRME